MDFSVSSGVRRLKYHDGHKVSLRHDFGAMFVTPSIDDNEFHRWLRDSFMAETAIGPKETQVVEIQARRGWHTVIVPAVHALSYLIGREQGVSEVALELSDGQMQPEQIDVKTGPVRVTVHNNLDSLMNVGVGFLGDDDDEHPLPNFRIEPFLTGKRVLTNQTFRALFKAETIEVGTGMQIKNLTVLFTDLSASTAMYERVGDLKALDIVRRHFEVLEGVIARQRGAVVKTIGDAVMAVFAEPDRAMAAATEMIDNVRQAAAHGEDLILKIGLHAGPCVAIQSNNQVDYFGRTVNIAARVQSLASGGEIVCSEEFWNQPGVRDSILARRLSVRKESAELKGIGDRFAVRRIVVASSPAKRPPRPAHRKAKQKAKTAASRRMKPAAGATKRRRAS